MAAKRTNRGASRVESPKDETKAEVFGRLAESRTNKACKAISLLAQLTGSNYESTSVQKAAIITALKASIENVENVFAGKGKASDSFKLPS